jgi:hypothetical protein
MPAVSRAEYEATSIRPQAIELPEVEAIKKVRLYKAIDN